VTLVARPEVVEIGAPGASHRPSATGESPTPWLGTVRRATYLGNAIDYEVDVEGQLLIIQETDPLHTDIFSEGQQVGVSLLENAVHVLKK
jgi:ABC-type Fe3+/spermidine/putrescine transport system ATPase subunit